MRQILSFIVVSAIVVLLAKCLVLDKLRVDIHHGCLEAPLLALNKALVDLILVLEGPLKALIQI